MRSSLRIGSTAACLALLTLPAAAAIRTEGTSVRVNRRTDFQQRNPAAALAPSGASVVAWENDQRGIRAQFYKVGGAPAGNELALVANPERPAVPYAGIVFNRRDPAVAYMSNGHLLVAWTEERAEVNVTYFKETRHIEEQDVFVQRFSPNGSPIGERYRVNAGASGLQRTPRLIARPSGFFAAWEDAATGSIVGRALDANGQPIGSDIAIGEGTGQLRPALAANGSNRILVVWDAPDASQLGVFGRLLDNAGAPVGPAFRINTTTANRQARPAVAADEDGNFLVAWQSEHTEVYVGFFYLYGQAVNAQGGLVGPELRLYEGGIDADSPQLAPTLASIAGGHFALSWIAWRDDRINLAALELDSLGAPVGSAVWLSERQIRPTFREIAVASNPAGRLLVSWESSDNKPSIAARRLNAR